MLNQKIGIDGLVVGSLWVRAIKGDNLHEHVVRILRVVPLTGGTDIFFSYPPDRGTAGKYELLRHPSVSRSTATSVTVENGVITVWQEEDFELRPLNLEEKFQVTRIPLTVTELLKPGLWFVLINPATKAPEKLLQIANITPTSQSGEYYDIFTSTPDGRVEYVTIVKVSDGDTVLPVVGSAELRRALEISVPKPL